MEILLFVGVLLTVALVHWYVSPHERALRRMRKVPVVRIADARDGDIVRIVGYLKRGPKLLRAPLTGRRCSHFRALVKQQGRRSWTDLVRSQKTRDFIVEDGSGDAMVESRRIDVAVVMDHESGSGLLGDPTDVEKRFLERHEIEWAVFGINKTLKFKEGTLRPGERVAVVGRARWVERTVDSRGEPADPTARRQLVIEAFADERVRATNDRAAMD